MPAAAAFYFDLASPLAYLAAERALVALSNPSTPVQWRGVLARTLAGEATLGTARGRDDGDVLRAEVERRAHELGLPPLRWPEPFPFGSERAMRVATFAASIGRAVPFAQAAFRQAFAGGHSLEDPDFVVIAAAECEMRPRAVTRAAGLGSVAEQLAATTAEAAEAGVTGVPTVVARGRLFAGELALERAGEELRA